MARKLRWSEHADLAINVEHVVHRNEFLDHMTFSTNSRPLFAELFGPIIGLKEEWFDQGATEGELDFSAFSFRFESRFAVPVNTGRIIRQKPIIIEESADHLITRDDLGRTVKLPKGMATIGLPLDFPVQTMDDWLEIKPLYEYSEERFGPDWISETNRAIAEGKVICVSIPGGYDEPRELMGELELSYGFYEKPELIHDILSTIGSTARRVLDRVSNEVQIDLLSVHEDMAGKSGALAGPKQIDEFIAPYYRSVWDLVSGRGAKLFDQDSDGDMNSVIQSFIDAGVNLMHPAEPAANMDIVKIREKHPGLAIYGGIDKHVIRRSREEIVAELEYKVPPMVASGGCVLGLDHRIPNGTPLEGYRFYHRKMWEILERESV